MNKSCRGWYWHLSTASLFTINGLLADFENRTTAQIAPDGTLGAESSVVTPTNINDIPGEQIDGGATRGNNLFHSFEQFSVPTGSTAHFNNAPDIQNIISRVTGKSISNIDGLIQANASANLFLINPNGIIFGQNAVLNIGGSFVASTASSLNFTDGTQFSATAPQSTPLLTVSVPLGLQFGGTAGSIRNQSQATYNDQVGLQVQAGKTLALVGGNVRIDGGNLLAVGGRVELGGLLGSGMVKLKIDNNNLRLGFPHGVAQADVFLTNQAQVDVSAGGDGSIAVNAQNLNISAGSRLLAGIKEGLGSVDAQAGDITLNVIDAITVEQASSIQNTIGTKATGTGNDINVTTGTLTVRDGSQLVASTLGKGDAGSVSISARDTVSFEGVDSNGKSGGVFSRVEKDAVGHGGNINVRAGSLSATNGAGLVTSTVGKGNAGSVNIDVLDTVSFDRWGKNSTQSGAFSRVRLEGNGDGGNIKITARSLSITNGAGLVASTIGKGNAGSVNINVRDTVSLDGTDSSGNNPSGAFSSVEKDAVGHGGEVNVTAGSLFVTNGAGLVASTVGKGNAGSVNINVQDTASFSGVSRRGNNPSGVFSRVESSGVGRGGDINIRAGSLSATNGAGLVASTVGKGNAGSVNINVRDTVSFAGWGRNSTRSGAFSRVRSNGKGNGGNINITARSLSIKNGAGLVVSTEAKGEGNAGDVNIKVRDTVSLDGVRRGGTDPSSVLSRVEAGGVGRGGNINVTTGSLSVTNGAGLSASSAGSGAAGKIEVRAGSMRLDNQTFLSADTSAGQGNITLRSEDLVLSRGSDITTNATGKATGGNINIDVDFIAAVEDSNISANAQDAKGGRVIISAQSIFGTASRAAETSKSDITASSRLGPQFSGIVQINTSGIDPARGLIPLPTNMVDASSLMTENCPAAGTTASANSEFVVTGRGGLPPSPDNLLSSDMIVVGLVTPAMQAENNFSPSVSKYSSPPIPNHIVEAQGWVVGAAGKVILTAAPTVALQIPWLTSANCHAS